MGKKLFVIYAQEELILLINFISQAKKENIPYELVYLHDKEPLSEEWRDACRKKVNECDGVVALISKQLKISEGAFWEIKVSKEANKPMICVFVGDAGIIVKPRDLSGVITMVLSWERLNDFFHGKINE